MSTTPATNRRWIYWLLLPTLAVSAFAWFDEPETDPEKGRARHARAPADSRQGAAGSTVATTTSPSAEDLVERLELPRVTKADPTDASDSTAPAAPPVDLLATRSWHVAPPPPPPKPQAPPLPFKVLGRIIEGDAPAVFLTSQDRNLIAREGVQLDNTYLVERIEKNRMTLIYLPLAERQYLTLGAVN